jgi:large subunit ribosomal protein L11
VSRRWISVKNCQSPVRTLYLSSSQKPGNPSTFELIQTFFLPLRSNARTAHLKPTVPVPTSITINPDRTFSFSFRTPPVAHLLRTVASIDKGSTAPPSHTSRTLRAATSGSTAGGQAPVSVAAKGGATSVPGGGFVGKVSVKQVYEIAKIKMGDEDLKVLGLERVARSVVGSARSMGLEVVP